MPPWHKNIWSADPTVFRVGWSKSGVHIMEGFLFVAQHISFRRMKLMIMLLGLLMKVTQMWIRVRIEVRMMKVHCLLRWEVVGRGEIWWLEIWGRGVREPRGGWKGTGGWHAADQLSQTAMATDISTVLQWNRKLINNHENKFKKYKSHLSKLKNKPS